MMFELVNRSPFIPALVPGMDKDDVAHLTVVVKGTFAISADGTTALADEPVALQLGDEHNGDDPASSVRFESDFCPAKPGTDVILSGHAYPVSRRERSVNVGLEVGPIRKVVRVVGDRVWTRAAGSWVISSPPVAFDKMPLVYERAFGGADRGHPDPARHAADERNPVGTGFAVAARSDRLEGLRLPNLEDPRAPIGSWDARQVVAGFGFIGRSWEPRRRLGGTYDAAWVQNRSPLLPADFDPRFFNGAPADQIASPHLRGGERVRVSNASPDGALDFKLPAVDLSAEVDVAKGRETLRPVLDTVVIEPDLRRLILCWRATARLGPRIREVKRVVVRRAG